MHLPVDSTYRKEEAGEYKTLNEILAYLNVNRYICTYALCASYLAIQLCDHYELFETTSRFLLSSSRDAVTLLAGRVHCTAADASLQETRSTTATTKASSGWTDMPDYQHNLMETIETARVKGKSKNKLLQINIDRRSIRLQQCGICYKSERKTAE